MKKIEIYFGDILLAFCATFSMYDEQLLSCMSLDDSFL